MALMAKMTRYPVAAFFGISRLYQPAKQLAGAGGISLALAKAGWRRSLS